MKNLLIPTLALIALSACNPQDLAKGTGQNTQSEFAPFDAEFKEAALSAGVTAEPVPAYITGDFTDRSQVRLGGLARCITAVDADGGKAYVEVYKTLWDQLSTFQKKKVYFFLQGKCLYNMNEVGSGIMRGVVQGEGAIEQSWSDYKTEFFSEAKATGFLLKN